MHELSIALSILDVSADEAERRGARVVAVHLKLGPLCGVVPEALVSAWELAREGTPLAESQLVIEHVPLVGYCPACASECEVESIQLLCCTRCGAPTERIVSGRELEVTALEIETPAAEQSETEPSGTATSEIES